MCYRKKRGGRVIYKLIAAFSLLIRLFYTPNPFEVLEYGYLINFMVEPFLHLVTFRIVGLYYRSGDWPALGSFLYLAFYWIHVLIISCFSYNKWLFALIVLIYIGLHSYVSKFKQDRFL